MSLRLSVTTETMRLPLRDPFRIARREDDRLATTVITHLDLRAGGLDAPAVHGTGEAFPVAYYGETAGTVGVVTRLLAEELERLEPPPADRGPAVAWLERAAGIMADAIGGHGGAKAGLDIALHDALGKRLGLPLWELLGTSPKLPPTDFSLGIDTPDAVAERARRVAHFPALKVKVGGPSDISTLEAVRAVYGGPLRVDANTAWQPEQARALLPELERLGVELVEQPFPAHQLPQLRWLQEHSRLPILADESAVFEEDLTALDGVVAGVVVKLAKCGGVGPGLRMARRARELRLKVMLGCMVETSVGIAAAAAIGAEADWLDLDGNLLLADDPFGGLELSEDCRWRLSRAPGLGLIRRPPGGTPDRPGGTPDEPEGMV